MPERSRPGMAAVLALAWAGVGAQTVAQPAAPPAAQPTALPAGDPARGMAIVASRTQGLCVLCHAVPGQPGVAMGTIGPPLAGVGARLTPEQLRQRLESPDKFVPDSVMPSYTRTHGLQQVASARQGQPLFNAQQLADVVAYLARLK